MTEDSGRREIGEVFKETLECEVITWKISNFSSLVAAMNGEMHSPQFSFKNATWILKMHPIGFKDYQSIDKISMGIERIHSEFPMQNFFFRFSYKNPFDNWNRYVSDYFSVFDTSCAQNYITIFNKRYNFYYYDRNIKYNDEITLVCEIQTKKDYLTKSDFDTKSIESAFSKNKKSEASSNSIGDLFKESFETQVIAWKIPNVRSVMRERVQSPEFSYEDASWTFKLFPWAQDGKSVDLIIDRLHSRIRKYSVVNMSFDDHDELKPSFEYHYTSSFNCGSGSFIFETKNTEENVNNILSYPGWMTLILSNKQSDIGVLKCILSRKKNAEISVKSQAASVQSAVGHIYRMTEYPGKRKVGEVFKETLECEVITWKIPNFTSLMVSVNTEVQSPQFFFKGATWVLKVYPFGCKDLGGMVKIVVGIERIHSELPVHNSFFRFSYNNPFENFNEYISSHFSVFDSSCARKLSTTFKKWYETFVLDRNFRLNDEITLVCEIQTEKDCITELDCETRSLQAALSRNNMRETSSNPIGELFKESFETEVVAWKIPNVRSLITERLQSPEFFYEGASWIFKMCSLFRTQGQSGGHIDVVLERLHSRIRKYSVINMSFDDRDGRKPSFEDYYTSSFNCGSGLFDSNHTKENVNNIISYPGEMTLVLSNKQSDTGVLKCVLSWKRNTEISLKSQSESVESAVGNLWKEKSDVVCIEASTQTGEETGNNSEFSSDLQRNKIIEDLKELYLSQEDCDVTFRVQEKKFPAHILILKARSPVLAATFRNDMKEKSTGIVDIEDCDPDTFSDLLCFLYYGEVKNLSADNVFNLFSVADKYDVPDLRTICVEFMKEKLSIDTFCKTISLALLHREAELIKLCTNFFAKNLQKIILTVEWQSFLAQHPTESNELLIKALVPNKP